MDDDQNHPQPMRPMTDEEGVTATADWRSYARKHGANGAPAVLRAENRAFLAGWVAGRHRESQRAEQTDGR